MASTLTTLHRKECMLCTHEVRYALDHNDTDADANCICMTQACMAMTTWLKHQCSSRQHACEVPADGQYCTKSPLDVHAWQDRLPTLVHLRRTCLPTLYLEPSESTMA